jgi:type II secretory pathway pseudopilin PulG
VHLGIKKMKPFSKSEIISLAVIFIVLIAVSIPNFIISLRRARDQERRDEFGILMKSLDVFVTDTRTFPLSSSDARILDCLKPGDKPVKNSKGLWVVNPIPCEWGKDALTDLITGKVYMPILPRDPDYQKGGSYLYFSDGDRYQIYAAMEGMDEPEIDPKIIALGLKCGVRICNIGRSVGVPTDISIEAYKKSLLNSNVKK